MSNEQQDRAVFVAFCIEQYAKAKGMGTEDVVKLFEQYGIVEHFCEFYDVLHTQGHHWLIEEIDEMINDNDLLRTGKEIGGAKNERQKHGNRLCEHL